MCLSGNELLTISNLVHSITNFEKQSVIILTELRQSGEIFNLKYKI